MRLNYIIILISLIFSQLSWASDVGEVIRDNQKGQVEFMFAGILERAMPQEWTQGQREEYLKEHLIFSRDYTRLLKRAMKAVASNPELQSVFKQNYNEEMGIGSGESHFKMYLSGLKEIGVTMAPSQQSEAMNRLLSGFQAIIDSGNISRIIGAFYISELTAVPELELMKKTAIEFSKVSGRHYDLAQKLQRYYDIHLTGAEENHQEELAKFIVNYEEYGIDEGQVIVGAQEAYEVTRKWWNEINPCSKALSSRL